MGEIGKGKVEKYVAKIYKYSTKLAESKLNQARKTRYKQSTYHVLH